jgi:predicted Holliday junction resolvase-like endonuclease
MPEPSLLLVLLSVAVAALLALGVKHVLLLSRLQTAVLAQVDAWRNRELEAIQARLWQAAQAEARGALSLWRAEAEGSIRSDAVRRSAAVVSGKVTEHLAPYMDGFPYNPKDARFLGTPVDMIVFDGMDEDALREIVFLEVKSGGSQLSTRERRVRDAVVARRVVWREFRVGGESSD